MNSNVIRVHQEKQMSKIKSTKIYVTISRMNLKKQIGLNKIN